MPCGATRLNGWARVPLAYRARVVPNAGISLLHFALSTSRLSSKWNFAFLLYLRRNSSGYWRGGAFLGGRLAVLVRHSRKDSRHGGGEARLEERRFTVGWQEEWREKYRTVVEQSRGESSLRGWKWNRGKRRDITIKRYEESRIRWILGPLPLRS